MLISGFFSAEQEDKGQERCQRRKFSVTVFMSGEIKDKTTQRVAIAGFRIQRLDFTLSAILAQLFCNQPLLRAQLPHLRSLTEIIGRPRPFPRVKGPVKAFARAPLFDRERSFAQFRILVTQSLHPHCRGSF